MSEPEKTAAESFYLIPPEVMDDLPQEVWSEVVKMPVAIQQLFGDEFRRKRKSKAIAYLLWLVLGAHYGYLGKWNTQLIYWGTAAGVGIWMIADLFRIPKLVREKNREIANYVLGLARTRAG
jgi:hypothetical protein